MKGRAAEMLKFENVTVSYGKDSVIESFSADLSDSRITALTGPSGSGKTTLLSVAAGIIKPKSGAFLCDKKASVMFQEPRLFPWLTALENVSVVLNDDGTARERAENSLLSVGITDTDKYPSELSGGMKQRVAFARALAYNSGLLLLDEPFSALDGENRRELLRLLQNDGRQVIFVTHNDEEALIADRVIELK